ncbi:MAG TPA: lactonase family protein [Actinoplanes sp.]|nr:lactonase family protein [Actinoplanes sp.]
MAGELVFLGCYTGETGGEGEGIALMRRDPATGDLTRLGVVARTPSPSFLAQHPDLPVLYAVNELGAGAVSAFAVAADGSLTELAVRSTGGAHPCHLAVTPDGRHLLAANYDSGSVSVHPLGPDGVPGERSDLVHLQGRGPDPERQQGPHAHMVAPDPSGPGVLITDLGSDRVWRARLDPVSGRLVDLDAAIVTAPGTGPRHLCRTADGALLIAGELSADLTWYRPGAHGLEQAGRVAATTLDGPAFPSEVTMGADGRFVYLANRGPNTVSVFSWTGGGARTGDGAVLIGEVPSGGDWPRHMALLADHLYVTNERSHSVTVFRIDPDTGLPQVQGEPIAEPSPTCLVKWSPRPGGR